MWQNIKSVLIGLSLGIFFLFAATIIVSIVYEDEVSQFVLEELNEYISTEIQVDDVKFSIIKKFPKASLELKDVLAKPKQGYFRKIGDYHTDTLFYAKSLFVEFDISSIFSKKYSVNSVDFRKGKIYLFVDRFGDPNYIFWETSKQEKTDNSFSIDLNEVNISETEVVFFDEKQNLAIETNLSQFKLRGSLNKENSSLEIHSNQFVKEVSLNEINYLDNKSIKTNIQLNIKNNVLEFIDSYVLIEKLKLNVDGIIQNTERKAIKLEVSGNLLKLESVQQNLPENIQNQLPEIVGQKGDVNLIVWLNSNDIRKEGIHVEAKFQIYDGQFWYEKGGIRIGDVSFEGVYTNGIENNSSGAEIKIDNINATILNNRFKGSVYLNNLNDPIIKVDAEAELFLDEIKETFTLDTIEILKGTCNIKAIYNGKLNEIRQISFNDLFKDSYDISLSLADGTFKLKDNKITVSDISGNLHLKRSIVAEDLFFRIQENDFLINGRISRLFESLDEKEIFNTNATIKSENINLNQLSPLFFKEDQETNTSGYRFPDNVSFQLKMDVGKFEVGKFIASEINGNINYKPRMFSLHEISFNTMDGNAKAGGVIIQKYNNDFIVKSQSRLNQININKLFYAFNNFGQEFIMSDNLKGAISGEVFLVSEWDDRIRVYKESVDAECKVKIEDGELVNFKPMEGLSRFIEVEELKQIKFETLENTISIKNQQVNIPEMDIQSSVLNIKASGEHLFTKEYIYHMELLLSDLLSKKLMKKKRSSIPAQMMEEDNQDRVKLFIKIEGDAEGSKIKYDRKAARADRKENLNSQKRELKQILNEEFGWFKNDSNIVKDTMNKEKSGFTIDNGEQEKRKESVKEENETKQKFTIEWEEETDTIK